MEVMHCVRPPVLTLYERDGRGDGMLIATPTYTGDVPLAKGRGSTQK
jgi:hypothetical protein